MRTFVIAGVTFTLTNRTARLYENYLQAWENRRNAVKSFCEGEMDWNDMESYEIELDEALEELMK